MRIFPRVFRREGSQSVVKMFQEYFSEIAAAAQEVIYEARIPNPCQDAKAWQAFVNLLDSNQKDWAVY